ncbi:hypothetical protein N752_28200 [Desulforamulus aquiferis]|nr:cation-transporting P-type ATPase [Desulforamulus aquiferis]RYD01740.1 hypothetical protein N752_28200 [Desulforamulus aquiferis]
MHSGEGNNNFSKCSNWHSLSLAETLSRLQTDLEQGLEESDVLQRKAYFGLIEWLRKNHQVFF